MFVRPNSPAHVAHILSSEDEIVKANMAHFKYARMKQKWERDKDDNTHYIYGFSGLMKNENSFVILAGSAVFEDCGGRSEERKV